VQQAAAGVVQQAAAGVMHNLWMQDLQKYNVITKIGVTQSL
jgi:hypothetical protein